MKMENPSNDTPPGHSGAERIAIAAFLSVLGFVTGIITVWMLTDLPGIDTGKGIEPIS